MANISVNYDSLANVQNKLNGDIADDQLETIVSDLTSAEIYLQLAKSTIIFGEMYLKELEIK